MAREYFQDILPAEGGDGAASEMAQPRSIRNIAPSINNRLRPMRPRPEMRPDGRSPKRRGSTVMLWGIAVLAVIALAFAVTTFFMKTTVTVVPRTHTVIFDSQTVFTAYPQTDSASSTAVGLVYTTDTKSFDGSVPVTASGTEQVSVGASGTITVYNAFSTTPQRLIKNTRFESPDGKVFRIRDSIVVPGKTTAGPGSVSATVYADEPGADYNIGPVSKFTLPGLKTTADMYAGIYGSSSAPMVGGFVGNRPSVSENAKTAAEAQIQADIKTKIAAAYADTTNGYALVSLAKITYSDLSTDITADGAATAKETATVLMPVIARPVLDGFLAQETSAAAVSGGATPVIHIDDPSTFSFAVTNSTMGVLGSDPLDFSLSGKATFVWQVDSAALAKDLATKNKTIFETVVSSYPAIDSATAKVYPLWSQAFPANPSDIKIVITPPVAGK